MHIHHLNQNRLRQLARDRAEVRLFCSHDTLEFKAFSYSTERSLVRDWVN